jgi:hypothetical protein
MRQIRTVSYQESRCGSCAYAPAQDSFLSRKQMWKLCACASSGQFPIKQCSGSFHHQAKPVRKTFIFFYFPISVWIFIFEEYVNVSSKRMSKKTKKYYPWCGVLKVTDEKSKIRIRIL